MDTSQYARTWTNNKYTPLMWLLLAFIISQTGATEGLNNTKLAVQCKENEYRSKAGFCCDRCSPGFRLTKECPGEGQRSQCDKCSLGTYMDTMNYYRNCFKCDTCNQDYAVEIKECKHDKNTVCGCRPEYYKDYIDEITWNCKPCKKCGVGERQTIPCTDNRNRVCGCRDDHYRVDSRTCHRCTIMNCSAHPDCRHLCPSSTPETQRSTLQTTQGHMLPLVLLVLLVVVTLIIIVGLISLVWYKIFRHKESKKRKPALLSQSPESPDPEKKEKIVTYPCTHSLIDEAPPLLLQPKTVLPDCVPKEIKINDFIYFVLEMVPISRFKELVRRLNVSEQDIDRALQDNRGYSEAQFQMLMVWIGSSSCGKSVLPRPLLQEFIDRLKEMNLNGCADNIEDRYCTED